MSASTHPAWYRVRYSQKSEYTLGPVGKWASSFTIDCIRCVCVCVGGGTSLFLTLAAHRPGPSTQPQPLAHCNSSKQTYQDTSPHTVHTHTAHRAMYRTMCNTRIACDEQPFALDLHERQRSLRISEAHGTAHAHNAHNAHSGHAHNAHRARLPPMSCRLSSARSFHIVFLYYCSYHTVTPV